MVMFTPDLHCACTEHSFPSHSTLSTSGNRGISCRKTKLIHNSKFIHIGHCGRNVAVNGPFMNVDLITASSISINEVAARSLFRSASSSLLDLVPNKVAL